MKHQHQQELETQLRAEQVKFDKLTVAAQQIDDEVRRHESARVKLKDSPDDVLAAPDYPQRIAEVEKAIQDAKTRREAFSLLVSRQRAVVQAAQDAITANRNQAFKEETKASSKEIRDLVSALADKMGAYQDAGYRFAQDGHALAAALYGWGEEGGAYRGEALKVANAALLLHTVKWSEASALAVAAGA